MKQWVPLFEIFLNSPSPESDASLYFDQQQNLSKSSFLSLLLTPAPSPSLLTNQNPNIFILTLPPFVQSRVLSFLTIESQCLSRRQLRSLAVHILRSNLTSSSDQPGFWVHRAAWNLLNFVSNYEPNPSIPRAERDGFYALPDWLQESITTATSSSWLPMSLSQLAVPENTDLHAAVLSDWHEAEDMVVELEEVNSCSPVAPSLDPQACAKASMLKAEVLASASPLESVRIAHDIRKICMDSNPGGQLALLCLIEPWNGDDETSSVLLSNLCGDGGLRSCSWPACVLCSVALPKFLSLRTPASRVLLSATISFCKLHPVAAVEALLFPLALCKGGINIVICDVLTRVIKDCLHKSHVSSFFQKLLCGKGKDRRLLCLPSHQDCISDELIWTEPVFTLFQNVLIQDVHLTPDCVDQLVSVIVDVVDKFSASLKFGNFFLSFVTKCTRAMKVHSVMLETAARKTNTFMTKSILSKLTDQ